jgi:flagellar motor protein MotB
MRVVAIAASLVCVLLPVFSGCANNPYALQSQNQNLQQQQVALQQRNQELQSRASTLDHDNQELETLLAQTRQQSKVLDDQLAAVREQLATTSAQLAQVRDEKQLTDKQTEALMASTRRQGAKITANSSLQRSLPAVNLPGIEVRPDGDVVRIELPSARLFQTGSTALQPVAGALLDSVAAEVARAYPEQKIGIEGHTDADLMRSPTGGDNQQLSVARATSVYQYLSARGQIPAGHMFIVGHGSSQPVVSNATAAGKARNGRVELVIYPEKAAAGR